MAKGQSIEKLYFSLGLDISELGTDFIAAEQTVNQNLARLNRESNLVRLRMQLETSNLDPVKDASKILKLQTEALNTQLKMQQDRLNLATAAWKEYVRGQGESAAATQRAERIMLQERLALQEIEKELQKLNSMSGAGSKQATNNLLAGYTSAKDKVGSSISSITNAFNELRVASSSTDVALTKSLEVIGQLRHPAVMAGVALASLPVVIHALQTELVDLARPAIRSGESIYVLSRRMATTVSEAASFNTVMKAMGLDTNTVLSSMERLSRQVLTAGESGNTVTKAFKAFGITLYDENGRLKSYHDRMLSLAEGFRRAKEAGQQMELQNILVRKGLGEMVVAIEDYEKTYGKVQDRLVKAGLANPELSHELSQELNLLDMQIGQLKSAFSNAMIPVAQGLIPQIHDKFARLTEIVRDNKDTIKEWGQGAADILSGIGNAAENTINIISTLIEDIGKVNRQNVQDIVDDESIDTLEEYVRRRNAQAGNNVDFLFQANPNLKTYAENYYENEWKKVLEAREEARKKTEAEASGEPVEEPPEKLMLTEEELASVEKQSKYLAELEELRYKSTHNAIENEIYDIQHWKDEQLKAISETNQAEKEREVINELAEAKISEAKRKATDESQSRAQEYLREARELSVNSAVSAYDRELKKIEEWKAKMKDKAYLAEEVAAIEENAAARAARAYETEMERVKNATKSFQDEIFAFTHSQYENDLKKVLDRYQEGLKQGLDKSTLDKWLSLKVADIDKNADKRGKDYKGDRKPSYFVEWGKPQQESSIIQQIQQILGAGKPKNGYQVMYGSNIMSQPQESPFIEFKDVIPKELVSVNSDLVEATQALTSTMQNASPARSDVEPNITNNTNITVQVDNVNADNTELVDRAAAKIAAGVKEAFSTVGNQYGYGRGR